MMRDKMSKSASRNLFTNTVRQVHPMNLRNNPMRGGWRL